MNIVVGMIVLITLLNGNVVNGTVIKVDKNYVYLEGLKQSSYGGTFNNDRDILYQQTFCKDGKELILKDKVLKRVDKRLILAVQEYMIKE